MQKNGQSFLNERLFCTHSQLFDFGTQDAQLAKAHSERESRRQQKEQMTDENDKLVAHNDLLKWYVVSPSDTARTCHS